MRIYLVKREKADFSAFLLCANYQTVLDVLQELDGTDEVISVNFIKVQDVTTKSKK